MATPNLGLTELASNHVLAYLTINSALDIIDAAAKVGVANMTLTAPPGSPVDGDSYVVAATATGAWVGKENQIAAYRSGAWIFVDPPNGKPIFDQETERFFVWDGTAWRHFAGSLRRKTPMCLAAHGIMDGVATVQTSAFTGMSLRTAELSSSADSGYEQEFELPKHASRENVNARISWHTTANATGDVRFRLTIYNAEDREDLNLATSVVEAWTDSVGSLDANIQRITTLPANIDLDAAVTEESVLVYRLERLATHGDDDFDQVVRVIGVSFEYDEKFVMDSAWS